MAKELSPTTLVIFGATGDLSRRYLLPALSEICKSPDIRAELKTIGVSRQAVSAQQILEGQGGYLAEQFQTFTMDYTRQSDYKELEQKLAEAGSAQTIFYFAVPPEAVLPIVRSLGQAGLNGPSSKLLMEKPFGTDLDSARGLIDEIQKYYKEEQIFRIDHYLAKEMAQNIAVFLGSNALFRDVWNNQFIEKIEVLAEESIGLEGRGRFYEQTGALRDFLQSHLLQLAALTLMEPCPDVFDFSQVQSRRLAALRQLKVDLGSVVIGQYKEYKQEAGSPSSQIETFVAMTLISDSPTWQGVPIRLITGKKLSQKLSEIRVYFKKSQSAQANLLRLRVQPKEGIEIELWVKKPGYEQDLQKLPLDFNYQQYFDRLPDAYEQVIVDAVRGNASLFASSDEVVASWEILQPVLDNWSGYELREYEPGAASEDIT